MRRTLDGYPRGGLAQRVVNPSGRTGLGGAQFLNPKGTVVDAGLSGADGAYASLRRTLVAARLLDRAYGYYAWRTAVSLVILLVGLVGAVTAPPAALFAMAFMIAFGSVQVGLIGHDAGHLAVFSSRRANAALGAACWSLALGISFRYWNDRHNRHHACTNDPTKDPDLQWSFGPILTPLLAFTFRLEGWRFAIRELRGHKRLSELGLMAISTIAWLLPTASLGWRWVGVFVVSQVLAGVYLALVVAPNHIGMPSWSGETAPPFFRRQLLSSRNIAPNPICDFVFGGLNYQIEHHLFPSMPRRHFGLARGLIKPFCAEHGLQYTESGVLAAYRALFAELPHVRHLDVA